jgi:nitrite reductase (NADH) large subunit
MKPTSSLQRTIVVIGNGMVSQRLCERLRALGSTDEIIVFGEEPRPAYDRVKLTSYYEKQSADELLLEPRSWYEENSIQLHTSTLVTAIDTTTKRVTAGTTTYAYDIAIFATGSDAFVPPLPGVQKTGVFVYRTIEDLDAIRSYAKQCKHATVMGGGLLGLEAAKAVHDMGLTTSVIEMAPRLMPRQLDAVGGRLLKERIEALGIEVLTNFATKELVGEERLTGIRTQSEDVLATDMLVISAGIRPRDELAKAAGITVGPRGGIVIDDQLQTSAPDVYAIGECALHRGMIYGLIAPGWEMADLLAKELLGETVSFTGADMSTKLKLLGVDVASFGDAFAEERDGRTIVFQDLVTGIYKKLVLDAAGKKLVGGMLVGEADEYMGLLALAKSGADLPPNPEALILGSRGGLTVELELPAEAQVCSCNNVSKGAIETVVRSGQCADFGSVKSCTKAGSTCGGCTPLVTKILNKTLASMGKVVKNDLCEHFAFTRQELYHIVRVKGLTTFEDVLREAGRGLGCETCKPAIASILASVHNDLVLNHASLQDTNDRFLANIQRQGTYSVVPRIPGGEITPQGLIVIGQVAEKYGLYTKITGGQRIDLFGARVEQLPAIWEELAAAGFESGHAYGKALRTVKSCVGSTWCRYGVQDSVGFAIRVENRYKGLRAPHKLKSAVSGCIRECAEAQSKDFGLIATDKGWNLYICGNGGSQPRHADLFASDLDEETAIRYIDRFLMYYIKTADKLTRTARWLENLEGGLEHLRDVIIHDKLGICAQLEAEMQHNVDTYQCEWQEVVRNPARRAQFEYFANSKDSDDTLEWVPQRDQKRPADWGTGVRAPKPPRRHLTVISTQWVDVGAASDFHGDAGRAVKYGETQLAVFYVPGTGEYYATQNVCPHKLDMVLSRGLVGDQGGTPKVACPLHKKTFDLRTGAGLSDADYRIQTFKARAENGRVLVELPDPKTVEALVHAACYGTCDAHEDVAPAASAAE